MANATPLVAVLGAGRGSRFGGQKLDALCAGKPVGRWVLDTVTLAGLLPGLVVVPPHPVVFVQGVQGWTQHVNAHADLGLGTSLALAAQWALSNGANQLIVLLADMPLIDVQFLRRLAAVPSPAATRHLDGRPGVPALLSQRILKLAATAFGDAGASRLLSSAEDLTLLDAPAGMLLDVDRPADRWLAEEMLQARLGAVGSYGPE